MSARTIAVVSAGLSQPSSSRLLADKLAAAAAGHLPAGTEVITIELRDLAHDIVNALLTGFPAPALREAIEQVLRADALIAVTPLYSGSYNGLFKLFFDVLDPGALAGKTVLIAATGGTARHSLALEHAVRPLFTYLRAITVPTAVFAATEDWGTAGTSAEALTARIDRAGAELAGLLERREPASQEDPYASVTPFEQLLHDHRSSTCSTRVRWWARPSSSRRPAARPGTRSRWNTRSARCSLICAPSRSPLRSSRRRRTGARRAAPPKRSPPGSTGPGAELASLLERREPASQEDPYASVTPFEQLLHDHSPAPNFGPLFKSHKNGYRDLGGPSPLGDAGGRSAVALVLPAETDL